MCFDMPKPANIPTDPLIAKIRKILRATEPRTLPTETKVNDWGHTCWVCPYCGELLRRHDRQVRHRYGYETKIDYSSFNMHFGSMHGELFWKEKQIAKLVRKESQK